MSKYCNIINILSGNLSALIYVHFVFLKAGPSESTTLLSRYSYNSILLYTIYQNTISVLIAIFFLDHEKFLPRRRNISQCDNDE